MRGVLIMRTQVADIVAYSAAGELALVVEVKNRLGTTTEWAVEFRRNLAVHDLLPQAPYFLLATPDRFYLWTRIGAAVDLVKPDVESNPSTFLRPYYESAGLSPETLRGGGFEMFVAAWLAEVQRADGPDCLPEESRELLIDSGLFEAIRGGSLHRGILE